MTHTWLQADGFEFSRQVAVGQRTTPNERTAAAMWFTTLLEESGEPVLGATRPFFRGLPKLPKSTLPLNTQYAGGVWFSPHRVGRDDPSYRDADLTLIAFD